MTGYGPWWDLGALACVVAWALLYVRQTDPRRR